MKNSLLNSFPRFYSIAAAVLCQAGMLHAEDTWWNKAWAQRQKFTLDTGGIAGTIGEATVLVRLSESAANLFASARQDGSDIRFIAADGRTELSYQIEGYDNVLNEAFVWVRLPGVKPGAKDSFTVYYDNQDPAMPAAGKAADVYSKDLAAVYHFAGTGAPADATANANNASAPAVTATGAMIGNGIRLLGNNPVTINSTNSLAWAAAQSLTLSCWIKPAALQPNAVLASRTEGNTSFRLLLDQGVPVVEITGGGSPVRSTAGAPLTPATWCHVAVTAEGGKLQVYVNGDAYASVQGTIPAMAAPILIGGMATETPGLSGFTGELDELRIHHAALPAGAVKLAAVNQGGSDAAQRMLSPGKTEGGEAGGHSRVMEHVMLFGDIANNMMFDGWMAIGVCIIMIVVGWTVAIRKFLYLNKIEKGNEEFLRQWKSMSTDLTAIDHADRASISSMGGNVDEEQQELMKDSPLYHIYHIGSGEISHRLDKMSDRIEGLPGRSIQAIRASLDTGLVHENHRLTDGLVFLTISIAGGPYVGLLGTVVGVMITFAIIAKSGEVNVNSIAPGIASALLATVVGLIVAIPALFIYSYLNGRIKNVVSTMQVFIDEFVAKMAEFYRPKNDPGPTGGEFSI